MREQWKKQATVSGEPNDLDWEAFKAMQAVVPTGDAALPDEREAVIAKAVDSIYDAMASPPVEG